MPPLLPFFMRSLFFYFTMMGCELQQNTKPASFSEQSDIFQLTLTAFSSILSFAVVLITSVFVFPPKLSCYFLTFRQPYFGASNCFEARLQTYKSLHRQTDRQTKIMAYQSLMCERRKADRWTNEM